MSLALRGSRETESGATEGFQEADIKAALRAKALRMYAVIIGLTAAITIGFTLV